jgi:uncharacterized repeat protein (TIGR02543 family)
LCEIILNQSRGAPFALNRAVTLVAIPFNGAKFTGWSGDCTGTAPTCTVTMTAAKTVTATFSPATGSSDAATESSPEL